jgi:hypothetical protein
VPLLDPCVILRSVGAERIDCVAICIEACDVPPEALLALDTLRRQERRVVTERADSQRQEKSNPSSSLV